MDFLSGSVASLAASVRNGEVSAREVTQHALDRIELLNPALGAFVAVDAEGALAQAARVDDAVASGHDPGPLAGVPMGVKDLEAARGFVTTFGSALHADDPAAEVDSVHVARYRAAGAVIVGKTNTPEFGHKGDTENPVFGQTRNPWSLGHSPGGSSGGTAAAVASGMIPLGTGSDGGGSIRIPASLCGLTGIKPETGRIPIPGRSLPGSGLLSANGPMGRTALDSAVALDVVRGPDPRDPLSLAAQPGAWADAVRQAEPPARVAWSPDLGFGIVDDEVTAACATAVAALSTAGTEVVPRTTVWDTDPVHPWLTLWAVARFKAQGHLMGTADWDKVSSSLQPMIVLGERVTGADYARAQDKCFDLNWELQDVLETASLLLCPTAAGIGPVVGHDGTINGEESLGWVQFTYGFNMTRNPAATVPVGRSKAGVPIGLQIIGRHGAEAEVLAAAAVMEQLVGSLGTPDMGSTDSHLERAHGSS